MDFLYSCKLDYPIGTKFVYSDLSFILLAEIAERRMGAPLDDFVRINLNRL
jgi:CubicO group peptidase (beta-lactamase class C family)